MPILSEYVLSGCLTVSDALAVEELARPGYWIKFFLTMASHLVVACLLIALAVSARTYSLWASNVIFLVGFMIFPGLAFFFFGFKVFRLDRLAKRKSGIFASTQTKIDTAHILIHAEGTERVLAWKDFSHFKFNEQVALLFIKDSANKIILARSKLSNAKAWDSLLALIQARI